MSHKSVHCILCPLLKSTLGNVKGQAKSGSLPLVRKSAIRAFPVCFEERTFLLYEVLQRRPNEKKRNSKQRLTREYKMGSP